MARGSIEKRKSVVGAVSYRARVDLPPRDGSLARHRQSATFATKRDAQKWINERMSEIDRGTIVASTKMTVAELLNEWLASVAVNRVIATTLEDYRATITNHLIPHLGHIEVQKLTARQVQAFYTQRLDAKTGKRTVELCHLRLSQALAQAVRWGLIARNVCEVVEAPRSKPQAFETWTPDEAKQFLLKAQDDAYSPLWLIALTTGARKGELLGLRWADFDAVKGTLTVRRAVSVLAKVAIIQETKTRASQRTISLPPEAVEALKAHRDRQLFQRRAVGEVWQDLDLIFANAIGGIVHPSNVLRNFYRLLDASKVKKIRFHDMRHTHATWLLADGVPITTVSERLGHAKSSITLDVYGHVVADTRDRAAASVGALLFAKSG